LTLYKIVFENKVVLYIDTDAWNKNRIKYSTSFRFYRNNRKVDNY